MARNLAVGIFPLQPAANGVITFINQNAADSPASGGYFVSKHAPDIMSRTGGRPVPALLATLETHSGLGGWLALCARKLLAFWHWYEIPNNGNYYYWCLYARGVCSVALTFAVIGPLGAVGLALALGKNGVAYAAAASFIASGMLISGLFLPLSRLRLPFACALIPFAALTLVSIARWLRSGLLFKAGATLAALAAVGAVSLRPLPRNHSTVWSSDYGTGNEIVHHLAERKAAAEDVKGALHLVEEQLGTEPEELRRLEPRETPAKIPLIAAETAGSFASLHELAGELENARQQTDRAAKHFWRAKVLRVVSSQWKRASQPGGWRD
jgi:hypothetical protein